MAAGFEFEEGSRLLVPIVLPTALAVVVVVVVVEV